MPITDSGTELKASGDDEVTRGYEFKEGAVVSGKFYAAVFKEFSEDAVAGIRGSLH